jgi:hypothetical protein
MCYKLLTSSLENNYLANLHIAVNKIGSVLKCDAIYSNSSITESLMIASLLALSASNKPPKQSISAANVKYFYFNLSSVSFESSSFKSLFFLYINIEIYINILLYNKIYSYIL